MSAPLWESPVPPDAPKPIKGGTRRALIRGIPLVLLITICVPMMLLVRAIESLVFGARRPWSSLFPKFVSRTALRLMGISLKLTGTPMQHHGAVVANHSSWLDIFVLNACQKVFFVAKSEVSGWPGIGPMARASGTVFIKRERSDAARQLALFEQRLHMGHKLLFFPEGTSTDSLRVLRFKPTLFDAFLAPALRDELWIQPVTVRYHVPAGEPPRFYGWWGDMDFTDSLLKLLKTKEHGTAEVIFHEPIPMAQVKDRREIAQRCEEVVRSALPPTPKEFMDLKP